MTVLACVATSGDRRTESFNPEFYSGAQTRAFFLTNLSGRNFVGVAIVMNGDLANRGGAQHV